jgi:ADP-ribose pyrophosphatase
MQMNKIKRVSEKQLFISRGSKFSVVETTDMVDKKRIISNFVRENDCVMVLPLLKNGNILLERQYRAAASTTKKGPVKGSYAYELPGGHIEYGESIKKAALRELEEETGYTAKRIKILYKRAIASYLTTAKEWICIAEGLEPRSRKPDKDEIINILEIDKDSIKRMLKNGKIEDTPTREALFYYLYFIGR